jgi:predicted dehydrogenase
MKERGKLGISGFGSIGQRHAKVAAALGWDLVLFDPWSPEAAAVATLPSATKVVASFDALLEDGIDALIVAGPDAVHAEQAIRACECHIPVLVEKPLAGTMADGRAIETSAQRTRTPVLCGYVIRHSAPMREALRLLDAGQLGQIASFHVDLGAYETLPKARHRFDERDRDRLYFDYSHEWDYLQWFFGRAKRVLAVARTVNALPLVQSPNVVDSLLELESAFGSVHLDYVQHPARRRLKIVGSRSSLEVDVPAATLCISSRATGETKQYRYGQERDDLFRSQLFNLAGVAAGRESPVAGIQDGIRALEVAEAMVVSSRHENWVRIWPDLP